MSENPYNAGAAAFYTFGARPGAFGALSIMSLIYLLVVGALSAALIAIAWQPFLELMRLSAIDPQSADPSAVFGPVAKIMGPVALMALVSIPFMASLECGVLRGIIHGERKGIAGYAFGADELRWILLFLLRTAIMMVAMIALAIFIGALIAAMQAMGNPLVNVLLGFAIAIGVLCAIAWPLVKLSAMEALMVRDRASRGVGASFQATKGVFWGVLGAYLIVFLVLFGVGMAVGTIQQILIMVPLAGLIPTGEMAEMGSTPDFSELAKAFAQPGVIIAVLFVFILQLVVDFFSRALALGVGAYTAVRPAPKQA